MLALEVSLNGKRVCVAGAEDLCVLNAIVTAAGKLGKKTVPARPDDTMGEVFFSVGGLTRRGDSNTDVHVRWKSNVPIRVGDVVEVKVLEADEADRASSRRSAARKRAHGTATPKRSAANNRGRKTVL